MAIVGMSGSGKSTLLNMMGGLDTPTSGNAIVRGDELAKKNDEELTIFRRRNIGFIFQNYNLVPILNVYEVERDNCNDWQEECNLQMPVFLLEREMRDGGVVPPQSEKSMAYSREWDAESGEWNPLGQFPKTWEAPQILCPLRQQSHRNCLQMKRLPCS